MLELKKSIWSDVANILKSSTSVKLSINLISSKLNLISISYSLKYINHFKLFTFPDIKGISDFLL